MARERSRVRELSQTAAEHVAASFILFGWAMHPFPTRSGTTAELHGWLTDRGEVRRGLRELDDFLASAGRHP